MLTVVHMSNPRSTSSWKQRLRLWIQRGIWTHDVFTHNILAQSFLLTLKPVVSLPTTSCPVTALLKCCVHSLRITAGLREEP